MDMIETVESALQAARQRLAPVSESAGLDAQVLLAHVLTRPRAWVLAHPEARLTPEQAKRLDLMLGRLENGEPLPYVLGHWEFFGLDFLLTPQVLIPRPETELMVARAIEWLDSNPRRRSAVDVGTGSGCIAVSLAVRIPDLYLLAVDRSLQALSVVRENALRHGVAGRVTCIQADLLPLTGGPFDLICANLPYIPSQELHQLEIYGKEPALALDGGADGLVLIRRLLRLAPSSLKPGGLLLLEIEANQGKAVADLARGAFDRAEVELLSDLAGRDRLVVVESHGK